MFDKMIFRAKIKESVVHIVVEYFHLQQCMKGNVIFYESSAYGNFDALFIRIRGRTIQVKCSIHKLYEKMRSGKLDNSHTYRISEAVGMIRNLFDTLCVNIEDVKVTYFEIGLNMQMERDPLEYIEMMQTIGDEAKEFFNDANFQKNRQRTTEKSRTKKKVFKVYDKTFEATDKRRDAEPNILRLETVYKRQEVKLSEFLDQFFKNKLANRFWQDWSAVHFKRDLQAEKGMKKSQLEKAEEIIRLGIGPYLDKNKKAFKERRITKKQWETIRNFARAWPSLKIHFLSPPTAGELEYKEKLLREFQIGRL